MKWIALAFVCGGGLLASQYALFQEVNQLRESLAHKSAASKLADDPLAYLVRVVEDLQDKVKAANQMKETRENDMKAVEDNVAELTHLGQCSLCVTSCGGNFSVNSGSWVLDNPMVALGENCTGLMTERLPRPKGPEFKVGAVGDNDCNHGVQISSEADCIEAAAAYGERYRIEYTSPDWPKGCFVNTANREWYFNKDAKGSSRMGVAPVCESAKVVANVCCHGVNSA